MDMNILIASLVRFIRNDLGTMKGHNLMRRLLRNLNFDKRQEDTGIQAVSEYRTQHPFMGRLMNLNQDNLLFIWRRIYREMRNLIF